MAQKKRPERSFFSVVPTGIEPVTLMVGDSVGNHIGFLPILIGLTMFLFWQPGRLCAVLVPIENR